MSKKAFTLVELMIVIAIIGILAAALFPSITSYLDRGRATSTKTTVVQLIRMIQILRDDTGKPLIQITGSSCSACACWPTAPYTGDPLSGQCSTNWSGALNKIGTAAGFRDITKYGTDGWGFPFQLDENDSEGTGCVSFCPDTIMSYGYAKNRTQSNPLSYDIPAWTIDAIGASSPPWDQRANLYRLMGITSP